MTTGEYLKLIDEGVILTQKIAILLNAKVGDKVTFTEDNNSYRILRHSSFPTAYNLL